MPYLFICAFIANAASFVLPVSNPANLVIYGSHLPPLPEWLSRYFLSAAVAIAVTFITLYFTQRNALQQAVASDIPLPQLSQGGRFALWGIAAAAVVLFVASSFGLQLGLPTAITGIAVTAIVLVKAKKNPLMVIKGVAWPVLPLVAGLFVIVAALNKTGLTETIAGLLHQSVLHSVTAAVWQGGCILAFSCNLLNNLPAGLIAGDVIQIGQVPEIVKSALLVGVDLGPNLSVTGSLATILWLVALRREHIAVSAWQFFKLGIVIMTITLVFAIAALFI